MANLGITVAAGAILLYYSPLPDTISSSIKIYKPQKVQTTLADVKGLDEYRDEIADIIAFLKTP